MVVLYRNPDYSESCYNEVELYSIIIILYNKLAYSFASFLRKPAFCLCKNRSAFVFVT